MKKTSLYLASLAKESQYLSPFLHGASRRGSPSAPSRARHAAPVRPAAKGGAPHGARGATSGARGATPGAGVAPHGAGGALFMSSESAFWPKTPLWPPPPAPALAREQSKVSVPLFSLYSSNIGAHEVATRMREQRAPMLELPLELPFMTPFGGRGSIGGGGGCWPGEGGIFALSRHAGST